MQVIIFQGHCNFTEDTTYIYFSETKTRFPHSDSWYSFGILITTPKIEQIKKKKNIQIHFFFPKLHSIFVIIKKTHTQNSQPNFYNGQYGKLIT